MRRLLLLLLCASALVAEAQRGLMERKWPDIIPNDGKMRRGGLYFAPGATYTLTRFKNTDEEVFRNADTSYRATFDPNGRFGLYLEAGWFHATWDPVILDYWDFGLAYKQLRGAESFTGNLLVNDLVTDTILGEGAFNDQHLTVHVNANKFIQTGDYQFVQLSLGANADWRFGVSREYLPDVSLLNQQEFPPELTGQVHFKAGYGFKVSQRLLIIPTLETPIFSIVPQDQGFGQLQWFSSLYRPIIFSVRFLILRYPTGWACPPVRTRPEDKEKQKMYKPDSYHP